jgi:hypothetical protein
MPRIPPGRFAGPRSPTGGPTCWASTILRRRFRCVRGRCTGGRGLRFDARMQGRCPCLLNCSPSGWLNCSPSGWLNCSPSGWGAGLRFNARMQGRCPCLLNCSPSGLGIGRISARRGRRFVRRGCFSPPGRAEC